MVDNSGGLPREGVEEGESGSNEFTDHRNKILGRSVGKIDPRLLPGIPDDITIDQIAPKLPWITRQMLWSVSRNWQGVIQSRQIYDSTVRSQSTEALVVMNHKRADQITAIAVYSVSDGSCCNLPPIPGNSGGMPRASQCISLSCKLYVLGGLKGYMTGRASARVFVFDLAGQRQWKECARKDRRGKFGCDVMNGKIYVFGGVSEHDPLWRSEVYDPETDSWSPIAPMRTPKFMRTFGLILKATAVGEELFVYDIGYSGSRRKAASAEVYSPLKDEWRSVKRFIGPDAEAPLLFGGKLHKLSSDGIDVYDVDKNSWKLLQRFPVGWLGPWHSCTKYALLAAVAVNGELLAIVECHDYRLEEASISFETCLLRSQGLGCKGEKIVWQRPQCSFSFKNLQDPFLCLVQL